tara:strand:+ start:553 stop:2742 length:2190 start_codon:yes stop_codon:yes gene_type:complete
MLKIALLFLLIPFMTYSQNQDSISIIKRLEEVNVNAIRANSKTPIAFTNINKNQIINKNLGQDLPIIVSMSPSLVTTSDAGAGVGYTSLRIRGTDPTRINVTINGIPLNDSESQGVWWVNMPDFSSSLENIQIQRGVGTSTNGSSAFGASINLKTSSFTKSPYFETNNTIGSYSTLKNNLVFGTGLIKNKFSFDGRISKISSDGYIDRASSDLKSLFIQGSYFLEKSVLKAIMFTGQEITYQAWNGVPKKFLDSNRTYNSYTYENEIDNYKQTHYQLHYSKELSPLTYFNLSAHYTHGEGYYEQEKLNEEFESYGLENIIFGNDTIDNTDLIRRKWLNNDFGGIIFSLKHKLGKMNINLGGGINQYSGQHYGNIIWAEYSSNSDINHQYYWNKGEKFDRNIYAKGEYNINSSTNLFVDLQNRKITYSFQGYDNNGKIGQQEVNHNFFNPKFGLFHSLNQNQAIYASFSVGNKEPNRNDYIESTPKSRPKHETLFDTELGYKINYNETFVFINLYNMKYHNQLVLTGRINDVGAYTRTNINNSFRQGIEIETKHKLSNKISISGNLSISKNKIKKFTEYIDNWDNWGQDSVVHENTDLAFSPNAIFNVISEYKISPKFFVNFSSKYVGKQYIDNTSSNDRMLDDYMVQNLQFTYDFKTSFVEKCKISLRINNIFNKEYVSNAWVYSFTSNNWDPTSSDPYVSKNSRNGYDMAGYFPEATRNFLLAITIRI